MPLGLIFLIGAICLNLYSIGRGLIKERAFYWVSFLNIFMWMILMPAILNYKP